LDCWNVSGGNAQSTSQQISRWLYDSANRVGLTGLHIKKNMPAIVAERIGRECLDGIFADKQGWF
jgi:hypothetical protein